MAKNNELISKQTLISRYHLSSGFLRKYFPRPIVRHNPTTLYWSEQTVQQVLGRPEVQSARMQLEISRGIGGFGQRVFSEFGIDHMLQQASEMQRTFTIHCGPTNAGKTYEALQALKAHTAANGGVYLGPLRLLALEVFDSLNSQGYPCTLRTGEELIEVPFSNITASTVEMADYSKTYDVAVIDEAQMIGDESRGSRWTKAILGLNAREVHICCAPEGLDVIVNLLETLGAPYDITNHYRLAPLVYKGHFPRITSAEQLARGDAIIAFSRRDVLNIAASLEGRFGIQASVIYGSLPPQARREEVRRFVAGETDIVVATDAIGMGVSLPIRRIVFSTAEKFDGRRRRELNPTEVKQIAGRAGRYGIYDEGEVYALSGSQVIKEGLEAPSVPVEKIQVAFPEEVLDTDIPLEKLLKAWDKLPEEQGFARADVREELAKLRYMGALANSHTKREIYNMITCPVDINEGRLVDYWLDCCVAIFDNDEIPAVHFPEDTLEQCEMAYKAYDIRHQMLRKIGQEEQNSADKIRLTGKINAFLLKSKKRYMQRCRNCGKSIGLDGRGTLCARCARLLEEGR